MKNRALSGAEKYIVTGGARLYGEIEVSSAKNSVLPLVACSLMVNGEVFLSNCEPASDAVNMLAIVRSLGGRCGFENGGIYLDCRGVRRHEVGEELTGRLRSSVFILGALVSRFRRAEISYPGGCDIGPRPIDLHTSGLRSLGVRVCENGERLVCDGRDIRGGEVHLPMPSVGATENLVMAAAGTEGHTVIRGAAEEPEIVDLQNFINACGGRVRGAGSSRIEIDGVKELHGTSFAPSGDRIAAGTYMIAGAICGGEITVRGCESGHLATLTGLLRRSGAIVAERTDGVTVISDGRLRAPGRIETSPYPGFPTDLQSPMTALAAGAKGTSYIIENLFENRFRHIPELMKMGADITVCGRAATVRGRKLHAADVEAKDLRGGAALVLAALGCEGRSTVAGAAHIDRGFFGFDRKLASLGAAVRRISARDM